MSALQPPPVAHAAIALQKLPPGLSPVAAFERLRDDADPWLLESSLRHARLGRFSFAGAAPWGVLRAFGPRLVLEVRRAVRPGLAPGRHEASGDPWDAARALLGAAPQARLLHPGLAELPFVGGAVGSFGYELAASLEALRFHGEGSLGFPDLHLLLVDRVLVFDHAAGGLFASGIGYGHDAAAAARRAEAAAAELAARVATRGGRPPTPEEDGPPRAIAALHPEVCVSEAAYAARIARAQARIAAGDVYQVCLTHRLEMPFAGDPWALYRALRRRSPAPFAAYLELPEGALVSSSPERFLRVGSDGSLESRPIKGTRPRGKDAEEDAALRRALAASAKDRAENVMIVDLVRNDLGRVCEIGSVEASELFAVEAYTTVLQMVSTVRGRLRPRHDALDAVRAAFPPGSMTGAPKLAAMRILDELEPVRRGPYSGALGWLDLRGGADLAVVIRTALVRRGRAFVHVGGGLVADSQPGAEWRETLDKARALLEALAEASGEGRDGAERNA
jgi:aminodeoxychorismate synthase component I